MGNPCLICTSQLNPPPLLNPGLCRGIMNICFANGTNLLIRKQKAVNPWLIPAYAWGLRGGGATWNVKTTLYLNLVWSWSICSRRPGVNTRFKFWSYITGSPISSCTCCHHNMYNIIHIMMTASAAAYRATVVILWSSFHTCDMANLIFA